MLKNIKNIFLFLLGSMFLSSTAMAGEQGLAASILAKGLYCRAFDLFSGDSAIILGLLLGFAGFLTWIWKQKMVAGTIMIIGGVCLTAVPAFFETTFENVTVMAKNTGLVEKNFDVFLKGRRSLGDCDQYQANLKFIDQLIISGEGLTGADGSLTVTLPDGTVLTIDEMIDQVLKLEGGCVDHPADKGGTTNYGITKGTLSKYLGRSVTSSEVCGMSVDTARAIYRDLYMPETGSVPDALMQIVFDSNVNHGSGNTSKIMANALKNLGVSSFDEVSSDAAYTAYVQARINFYVGIIRNNPSQMVFANGWTNRMREFGYTGPELRDLI